MSSRGEERGIILAGKVPKTRDGQMKGRRGGQSGFEVEGEWKFRQTVVEESNLFSGSALMLVDDGKAGTRWLLTISNGSSLMGE